MIWAFLLALFGVIALSAFFSGSETALMSVRDHRLRALERTQPRAGSVRRIVAEPERMLGAVLTGNVFVNTLAGVLVTMAVTVGATSAEARASGATIATILVTVLLLIFGEMVPKSIAAHQPERWSVAVARPVRIVLRLLGPASAGLAFVAGWMLRVLGISRRSRGGKLTPAELRAMVLASEEYGNDDPSLVHRLMDAAGRRVSEVMVPRRGVNAVGIGASLEATLSRFQECGHTRMPVFVRTLDDVKGILDIRDVLKARAEPESFSIEKMMRPAKFVPDSATLTDVLEQMREKDVRMILVVDEHAGVEGLVTSRTLMDAIASPAVAVAPDGITTLDASMRVETANARLRFGVPEKDEYDTVAGFVLSSLGEIPRVGDRVDLERHVLRVEAMDGHRVVAVAVVSKPATTPADGREDRKDAKEPGKTSGVHRADPKNEAKRTDRASVER